MPAGRASDRAKCPRDMNIGKGSIILPLRKEDCYHGERKTRRIIGGNSPSGNGKKLLERAWDALMAAGLAEAVARQYVSWMREYVLFHGTWHPEEMGALEVEQFLTYLAVKRKVAKDTQRQALNALVFLYRTVLGRELGKVMPVRGRHGKRLPVVLTRKEVPSVLQRVAEGGGMHKLMAELMYGSGLRVKECCRLRVKDVDLERLQLAVRGGKGDQDRVTVLPRRLVDRLREQIERVRRLHEDDLALGFGRVWLPPALRRKYPNAELELGWQYLYLHVMEGGTTDVRSPLDLLEDK